jgi:hypothetical protein
MYKDKYGNLNQSSSPTVPPDSFPVYTDPPGGRQSEDCLTAAPMQEPVKLWLWKNFVDGKPEYLAFDNPFPCVSAGGGPLTLGEPCGWALLKHSVNGRSDRSEQEVINTVTRLATPPAAQRPVAEPHKWVGLTDEELSDIYNQTDWNVNENWDYERAIEAKLREKNGGQA